MKKLYSKGARACLIVLGTLFAICFIVSGIVAINAERMGFFSFSENEARKALMRIAAEDYAVIAAMGHDKNFNAETLSNTNLRYAVVKGDKSILNEDGEPDYLFRNFEGEIPEDHQTITLTLSKGCTYAVSDKLFGQLGEGPNHIIESEKSDDHRKEFNIEGIGYDRINQSLYVFYNGSLQILNSAEVISEGADGYTEDGEEFDMPSVDDAYSLIWENRRKEAGVSDNRLYIDGKGYEPVSNILKNTKFMLYSTDTVMLTADNVADISSLHDELDTSEHDIWLENPTTIGTWESLAYGQDYTFICFPAPDMVLNGDYYSQAETLLANRGVICGAIIAAMVIFGLLVAACVVLYILAAGHDKDKEGISETIPDRMPMEVSAFVFLMIAFFPLCVIKETNAYESVIYYVFLAIALVIMFVSVFLWIGTVAVNVKRGQFWKNTVLYKLFIKGMIRWGREFRFVFKNLKMGVRVWLIFAAVSFAEMFCLAWFDVAGGFILLWLIEKVLVIILIHKILKQFAVLKNTALSIAAGDVTEPVDTSKMLIDYEEQGNALNIIRTGMNEAMDERIKSERLKTELITNVSHDIKTPLTSIINYVDLMQKEKTDNEKINEYLEVLDRQSGKLKKLIEDLIEASKAATGNIKMQMEDVNARVLLNQSIGEFEERLEQKNIKLVTEVPEEDIHIQADSRYLWRVLDNLMNNIVKYSQEGTRAYVDLKQLGDHVRFVFRNTSRDELNISADELMERFVRGDASRNTDGNGLGLSIASSLTEAMGGKLTLSIDGDLFKATVEF